MTLEEIKEKLDILRVKRKEISKEIKILANRYYVMIFRNKQK